MCHVPSWIKTNTKIYFLTDKDVTKHHENTNEAINWNDYTGHSGIEKIYGVSGNHVEGFPCPPELMNALLSNKMYQICRHAENISEFPKEMARVLEILSTDEDSDVRCNVAENVNTPIEILTILSTDKNSWVRCNVAENVSWINRK